MVAYAQDPFGNGVKGILVIACLTRLWLQFLTNIGVKAFNQFLLQ